MIIKKFNFVLKISDVHDFELEQELQNEINERESIKSSQRKCNRKKWKDLLKDYFNSTSVHGLQYLMDDSCSVWERILWLIVISISIYCVSVLILQTYNKWEETPVIVSFSEKSTPVWHIPFPAVTICPETKAQRKFFNFTETYKKLMTTQSVDDLMIFSRNRTDSDEEFEYLQAILQVCEDYLHLGMIYPENLNSINYVDILEKLSQSFNQTMLLCKWKNSEIGCDALFEKVHTDEGICYKFNGLNSSELFRENTFQYQHFIENLNHSNKQTEWSLENGYNENDDGIVSYPERVLGAGFRAGFFTVLQGFQFDMDYMCRGPVQGFKVLLHSPDDIPLVSKQFVRIGYLKEVLISVSPRMITTSSELKDYPPARRQCYYGSERFLKYFKIYTQANCETECLTNHTLSKCGCAKFSMPRLLETPVCNASKLECLHVAEDELLKIEFTEGLLETKQNFRGHTKCNCLPTCTSLAYQSEISLADFEIDKLFKAYDSNYAEENPGVQMSRLTIFFKENQFITSKRSELFGIVNFLANVGGLLGLFMGISALSIAEFFYHFIVRLSLKFRCWAWNIKF